MKLTLILMTKSKGSLILKAVETEHNATNTTYQDLIKIVRDINKERQGLDGYKYVGAIRGHVEVFNPIEKFNLDF